MINKNIYIQDVYGDKWPVCTLIDSPNFFSRLENRYKICRNEELSFNGLKVPIPNLLSVCYPSWQEAIKSCQKLNETWIIECVEAGRIDKEKYWTEQDHKYYNELKEKYGK